MPIAPRSRRTPTQERSRRTVQRILDAAEALVGESGIDAATTRAIAERAGVAAPSLYRFFADRDEVLDAVLERALQDLDGYIEQMQQQGGGDSIAGLVRRALEVHIDYYERHPSLVKLWFGGRVSPPVVEEVHERNRNLAHTLQTTLIARGLVDPATPDQVFEIVVEFGDRLLALAFSSGDRADRACVETGVEALTAILERYARD